MLFYIKYKKKEHHTFFYSCFKSSKNCNCATKTAFFGHILSLNHLHRLNSRFIFNL